jgi:hypothetical protein
MALGGCGYRPARSFYGAHGFAVAPGPVHVSDAEAALALEAGARVELSRHGALANCAPSDDDCATLVVELLRIDEVTEGVSVGAGSPLGGGTRITASGRATTFRGSARETTAEVSASEVSAAPSNAATDVIRRSEGARRAARRLGERLVRIALRMPEPSGD